MAPQGLNQFGQSPIQGMVDLHQQPNTVSCMVDASQATPLIAGQAVKLVDSAGGVPKVVAVAADTDPVFGFVNHSLKSDAHKAGQALEISLKGNVMYMTASAAIARGAPLGVVVAGSKVVAKAAAGVTYIGWAYDKAAGNGDLIRVYIETPNNASGLYAADLAG